MKKTAKTLLSWAASLGVPVVMVMLIIGLLLTPLFVGIEYRLPHFPEDPYGFTKQERHEYGQLPRQ